MSKNKDYRNTSFRNHDFTLGDKKDKFMDKLRIDHPNTQNIYNVVSAQNSTHNLNFRKIYNEKCSYCGVTTQVINSTDFEVDHFIPKTAKGYSLDFLNSITNIVSSCKKCNRIKRDFLVKSASNLLHPDNNNLETLFFRDIDFSIKISQNYRNNLEISNFFNQLELGSDLRRIDYLIMELNDFCDEFPEEAISLKISGILRKISNFRRQYN